MRCAFLNANKTAYITFCESGIKYVPIFSKPWWLECTTNGDWDVLIAYSGGKPVAFHPYYFVQTDNGLIIKKATLTQNNGIIFNTDDGLKYQTKLLAEKRATTAIIEELIKLDLLNYRQYFHFTFTDWLPFYWNSFSQTTRYTYVIESNSIEDVALGLNSKLRNEIKKASSLVFVDERFTIEELYENVVKTFKRQGLDVPYTLGLLKRIDTECEQRNSRHFFVARDQNNHVCSCVYLVEDEQSVYYLISGSDPDYKNTNALSLLIYKGIEYAIRKGKRFDFEGSMKQNIEKHFAQFGAKQYPYMDIKKEF